MSNSFKKKFLLMCIFVLGAFLATYPAFFTSYFKTTMDGQIHLVKFESVLTALIHFQLPQLVNYMGYANVGEAFNGMYPWLAGIILFLPRLFISQPVYALFGGLILVNLLTIINTYLLTRQLTHNIYWRLLGVVIYEFNNYHLTVMYGRNAFGEMLAYAFLPLVFLGYLQIIDHNSKGIWALGIGMGMIVNSHVITSIFAVLVLTVIELGRICLRKVTLKEIVRIIYAGSIAALVSCYTLGNMLLLMSKNHLITPWKALWPVGPGQMWDKMLANSITDNEVWHIGLISFMIFIALIVQLFKVDKVGEWKLWTVAVLVIYVLIFNWIPYPPELAETFLGNIQFLGRLLSFVMIFLVIALCQYLERYGTTLSPKMCLGVISVVLIVLGFAATKTFHDTKDDDPIRYYLNNQNYLSELTRGEQGWYDYMISAADNEKKYLIDLNKNDFPKREAIKATYEELSFKVDVTQQKEVKLPFLLYNGVKYNVSVNGQKVNDFNEGQVLTLWLKKGINTVKITSEVPKFNYLTFGLSVLTIIVGTSMLFVTNLRGKMRWQKNYRS